MAPERSPKRVKTNPTDEAPPPRIPQGIPLPTTPSANDTPIQRDTPQDDSHRSSWYTRTWPRKAAPVTEVVRESISSASNAATEAIATVKRSTTTQKTTRSPSLAITLGNTTPSRALPVEATTSTVHAKPEASSRMGSSASQLTLPKDEVDGKGGLSISSVEPMKERSNETMKFDIVNPPAATHENDGITKADQPQASWFPWLSKTSNMAEAPDKASDARPPDTIDSKPLVQTPSTDTAEPQKAENDTVKTNMDEQSNKRSWLQMWSAETPTKPVPTSILGGDDLKTPTKTPAVPIQASKLKVDSSTTATSQASSIETAPPQLPGDGTKSAAWIFWSRAQKNNSSTSSVDQPHVGEIAISDTPSAAKPKRASFSISSKSGDTNGNLGKDAPKTANHTKTASKSSQVNDQDKAKLGEVSKQDRAELKASMIESSMATAMAKPPADAKSLSTAVTAISKQPSTAQLLPLFTETFAPQPTPSLLEQIGRLLNYTKTEPEPKHLNLINNPPRIKNALAIGVHGYFPTPLIRTVLGQPTGTSIKFADMAAKSIRNWTKSRGYECTVKEAALEGEGKIAERIDLLWKLLLNWIDEIRRADFIMVACHSQGVPVAIMLVAKLIDFGCVNAVRIGICAMAGVSMGPFLEYKTRWISGSAGELFEFSDPKSQVSTNYISALNTILKFGCRLSFVGSIDDQLVSLESSVFSTITHPHIYRAVLIDGRTHTPNFLSHLVGFALKLRNLGVTDHGLIRELSNPLAGSLYSGQGHSIIYEELSVYDLAVSFAMETNDLRQIPLSHSQVTTVRNPYILPFALRGVLEEDLVKTKMRQEAEQLLKQFDDWKPTTKALQDVKFRLEGIRSKL